MLQGWTGEPATALGDTFVIHMDREALGDRPMGKYDVIVTITGYEQDRYITWEVSGENFPSIGHYYGYRLEPVEGGTRFTWVEDVALAFPLGELAAACYAPVMRLLMGRAQRGLRALIVASGPWPGDR